MRFLFLLFLLPCAGYAQEQTIPDNVAVVSWVGYDNRWDFKEAPALIKNVFCDEKGAFCIEDKNYFTIEKDAEFPDDFDKVISEAVKKIKDKENSVLILAIDSHGKKGWICRQDVPESSWIPHDKFVDEILKVYKEGIKEGIDEIILFIDTCHAGSISDVIKEKLACNSEESSCYVGSDKNKYDKKITVYSASPSDEEGYENLFWKTIKKVGKEQKCRAKDECGLNGTGISKFIFEDVRDPKYQNTHIWWCSYSDKDFKIDETWQVVLSDEIINVDKNQKWIKPLAGIKIYPQGDSKNENSIKEISSFLHDSKTNVSPPSDEFIAAAIKVMGKISYGNEMAAEAFIDILENYDDDWIKGIVKDNLIEICINSKKTLPGELVVDAFQNSKNKNMKEVMLEVVDELTYHHMRWFENMLKNKLISALERDNREDTRREAAELLGKYLGLYRENETVTVALVDAFKNDESESVRLSAAEALDKIREENNITITALSDFLKNTEDYDARKKLAKALERSGYKSFQVDLCIEIFKGDDSKLKQALKSEIENRNKWLIDANDNYEEDINEKLIDLLYKMGSQNESVINVLIETIFEKCSSGTSQVEGGHVGKWVTQCLREKWEAMPVLGKIGKGNETAIKLLLDAIEGSEEKYVLVNAIIALGKISNGSGGVAEALVHVLKKNKDEAIKGYAAEALGEMSIGTGEKAVKTLKAQVLRRDKYMQEREDVARALDGAANFCNKEVIKTLIAVIKKRKGRYWKSTDQAAVALRKINRELELVGKVLSEVRKSLLDYYDYDRFWLQERTEFASDKVDDKKEKITKALQYYKKW